MQGDECVEVNRNSGGAEGNVTKVQGASHFYISDEKALQIYKELQALTSGYLVPKLAREIGGEPNKTLYTA